MRRELDYLGEGSEPGIRSGDTEKHGFRVLHIFHFNLTHCGLRGNQQIKCCRYGRTLPTQHLLRTQTVV